MPHRRHILAAALLLAQGSLLSAQQVTAPPVPQSSHPGSVAVDPLVPARGPLPSAFGTIQGNALDPANAPLPRRIVRLRGTRTGQITDAKLTDASGVFMFRGVEPGNYVVELLGGDQEKVLAASQLLTVDAGDTISAMVKMPIKIQSLGGLLGNKVSAAAIVAATAATAGVLSVRVGKCVSPPCEN